MKYLKMFKQLKKYFNTKENINYKQAREILLIIFKNFSQKELNKFGSYCEMILLNIPRQTILTDYKFKF